MAKISKYEQLIANLPDLIGGTANISFLNHCMTRLRITVKDQSLVKADEIKKQPGVLGIQWAGEQLQIVIGQNVSDVYALICKETGLAEQEPIDEKLDGDKKKFDINTVFDYIFSSTEDAYDRICDWWCAWRCSSRICKVCGVRYAGKL